MDGEQKSVYLGRGSFAIVKAQMYRGIKVAVKEFLPRCVKDDVLQEAAILSHLCHLYLPLLLRISSCAQPLRCIMQFHGVDNILLSSSLFGFVPMQLKDELFEVSISDHFD